MTRWNRILTGIPRTGPSLDPDGNVIPLQISLDAIEMEIIEANNQLVHWETEAVRVEKGYADALERMRAAQMRFIDRLKKLNIRAEIVERAGLE